MSRLPGIRFVESVARRVEAAEPALQTAFGKTDAWEWQFTAAHEDAVPDSVLRAAGAVTIAVLDTGADITAPDIAAKNPVVFSPRTGSADVRASLSGDSLDARAERAQPFVDPLVALVDLVDRADRRLALRAQAGEQH